MYVVLVLMLPPVNCTGANGTLKAGSAPRELHLHARRIHVELLGHRHRESGVDALAHLRLADDDGDGVIRRDAHEGVRLKRAPARGRPQRSLARNALPR